MELIRADLLMVLDVFNVLDTLSKIEGVHEVEIKVTNECGDEIVIGYGESGDPCVLAVNSEHEPFKPNIDTGLIYPTPYPGPNYPFITWNSNTTTATKPSDGYRNQCSAPDESDDFYGDRY